MQTNFTAEALLDPQTRESEKILRTCVHCGFCTATCPTYLLLGDELDSPRGRIYLIKDMLEGGRPANKEIVTHVDRCLSCLSCMTTCPSGVNYMHLVDHARAHIEQLLAGVPGHCALVTAIDGHPATLGWLGSVQGHRTRSLGVERFGQTGTIADLYRHFGIDAQGIARAAQTMSAGAPIRHLRAME